MKLMRVCGGWIIANGDRHAHFESKRAAEICIDLLDRSQLPTNRYYLQAAKRLLSDEDFSKLKTFKSKPAYINRRGANDKRGPKRISMDSR